jgi:hypothetical protein
MISFVDDAIEIIEKELRYYPELKGLLIFSLRGNNHYTTIYNFDDIMKEIKNLKGGCI